MNTYIYINKKEKINDIQFEVVETKGKGHPDNICDTLAEKISSNYSKYCMEKYYMMFERFSKLYANIKM